MVEWAIPEQLDSDGEPVRAVLERARQAWTRQAAAETLGLLRHAAGLAAQQDDDMRAIQLFIAAAEVADIMSRRERAASGVRRAGPQPRPWAAAAAAEEEDSVKKTAETPRTKLRRAMLAIDPEYAERVDFGAAGEHIAGPLDRAMQTASSTAPAIAYIDRETSASWSNWAANSFDDLDDLGKPPRANDRRGSRHTRSEPGGEAPVLPAGALPVFRVNLVSLEEEGEIRLLFVSDDTPSPRDLPTGLLVPTNEEDAALLRAIYDGCDAKL